MSKKRSIVAAVGTIISILMAVFGGLFVAGYLCLFSGIVQIIHGVSATPVVAPDIALGIVRIVFAPVCGWLTFGICLMVAKFFATFGLKE